MAKIGKDKQYHVREAVEKLGLSQIARGNVKWCHHFENSLAIF